MGGDETARALYLLLLGLLVASGVLATYRGRIGAALRHAFVWALIFAVVALLCLIFAPEPVFTPTPGRDDRRAESGFESPPVSTGVRPGPQPASKLALWAGMGRLTTGRVARRSPSWRRRKGVA